MEKKRRIGFPRMDNYNIALQYLVETGLNCDYVMAPPMTRKTLELGSKYSPDFVCAPFKYTLGSMLEMLQEDSVDAIVETGGVCRLGYYGELQRQILRDLGYQVDFVNLADMGKHKLRGYYHVLHQLNPQASIPKALRTLRDTLQAVRYIDELEGRVRVDRGFEIQRGSMQKIFDAFLQETAHAHNRHELEQAYQKASAALDAVPLNKPVRPLRVGIIGEYYTVMDDFGNHNVERILSYMGQGVEIHRWMTFTHRNLEYNEQADLALIAPYVRYSMGPTSSATLAAALRYAEQGFDGIVHVKSFGCTPEVDVMPVLQNISADLKIPILYLSYDSQTGDAGIQTRLEAFYDMIEMKRKTAV